MNIISFKKSVIDAGLDLCWFKNSNDHF